MANYVLIVSGQSNAVGRAANPLADAAVAAYSFSRTKIWWSGAWQNLNPNVTQTNDQSASNHGVEPYIGYWFEQNYPNDTLYIIKFAAGGMGLDASSSPPTTFDPATGTLYASLKNTYLIPALASAALSGGYTPLGFWWMQGETDSLSSTWADNYFANLTNFFNALAFDVPATANFRRIIGAVRENVASTYRDTLRAAQAAYCAIPANNATLIQTDAVADNGGADTVHYSAAGFVTLGRSLWRLLNWNSATASTHQQHKHRRVAATTAGVSTDRLLYGKLQDDLVVGEILADVRAEGPGLYFIDEDGNVARIPVTDRLPSGSAHQPTVAFRGDKRSGLYAPSAGNVGLARNGRSIWATLANALGFGTEAPARDFHFHQPDTDQCVIQVTGKTTGVSGTRGFNLAILDATGNAQFWNWENGYLRFGTNGAEIVNLDPATYAMNLPHGRIKFPVSQNASTDANTLDDYEEGTFTATLTGLTTAPTTPVTTTGYYTKVGRLVHVNFAFTAVDTTGASGLMRVTGLPFAAAVGRNVAAVNLYGLSIPNKYTVGFVDAAATNMDFFSPADNAAWSSVNITAGASKYLLASLSYQSAT